jgi:uncharacterized membrane protein (Fun14 family)
MDFLRELLTPALIVCSIGIIMGFILGWSFRELWQQVKWLTGRFIPGPIKYVARYVVFAGIIIFAIYWTVFR